MLKNIDYVVTCDLLNSKAKIFVSRSIETHLGELGHATIITIPMIGGSISKAWKYGRTHLGELRHATIAFFTIPMMGRSISKLF